MPLTAAGRGAADCPMEAWLRETRPRSDTKTKQAIQRSDMVATTPIDATMPYGFLGKVLGEYHAKSRRAAKLRVAPRCEAKRFARRSESKTRWCLTAAKEARAGVSRRPTVEGRPAAKRSEGEEGMEDCIKRPGQERVRSLRGKPSGEDGS